MKLLGFYLLISVITSCNSELPENNSINGVWKSLGSGWLLHIEDSSQYSFYDVTSISCLPNRKGLFRDLNNSLSLKDDTLSLLKGVITYKFIRTPQLPELCKTETPDNKQNDPLFNYEVFAETVKDNYAFMELNNINWSELYIAQKNKLKANPTEIELYKIIDQTLEKLNDNHAYLEATEEIYLALENNEIEEKDASDQNEKLPEYGDFQIADMVAKQHLKEDMTKDSWLIKWGKLNDEIGYIQVKAMWLYADLNIPKSLIEKNGYVDAYVETFHKMYEGNYIKKEAFGIRKIMDRIMKDLSNMNSMVIDVRFNGGGQDAVSFEILRRFIPLKLQVATQKLRYGNSFSPLLSINIEGTSNAYIKPVYILTSQQTGSAAEAFSIATMAMKNVKRIGAPTSGAMSTALEKTLPNGWSFAISNEVYMDNLGNQYENKGIPVDYDLKYPAERQTFFRSVVDDLEKDKLDILKAIEALKNTF